MKKTINLKCIFVTLVFSLACLSCVKGTKSYRKLTYEIYGYLESKFEVNLKDLDYDLVYNSGYEIIKIQTMSGYALTWISVRKTSTGLEINVNHSNTPAGINPEKLIDAIDSFLSNRFLPYKKDISPDNQDVVYTIKGKFR